jgi:hypothetical protein
VSERTYHWTDLAGLGLTYRQVDHWTRLGYLRATQAGNGGSGRARSWPAGEYRIAEVMARLVAASIPPELAHQVARNGGYAEPVPGVHIIVAPAGVADGGGNQP